ncbi:MAG: hypothetical protein KDK91_07125 [Gammaproteobacteria bacterium]|nr:hypothetical protein [Gammaproteobacteria bacterium]
MRTTVTIEPEAERLLKEAMRRRGQTFKEVLNRAILKGLADLEVDANEPPFVVEATPMGLRPGIDPAKLNQLNDELESEHFLSVSQQPTKSAD